MKFLRRLLVGAAAALLAITPPALAKQQGPTFAQIVTPNSPSPTASYNSSTNAIVGR